jgi:hypothetical protein
MRKRALASLLISILINQTLYWDVASLLPNMARENYCMNDTLNGIILGMF